MNNAPDKPKNGEPCNGCGYCCASELCVAAEIALGDVPAPCPLMRFKEGRFWCGLVLTEKENGMAPMIATSLGIGIGCLVED